MLFSTLHDLQADALYITLNEGNVARTVELDAGTMVDVDQDGRPLGLEVVHPHRRWPVEDFIQQFKIGSEPAKALRVYAEGFHAPPPSFGKARKASTGSGKLARLRLMPI